MLEHTLILQLSASSLAGNTTSRLRQEYQALQRLFAAQPATMQEYLRNEAATLAGAILNDEAPIHFSLPVSVACLPMMDCSGTVETIVPGARQQRVGNLVNRWIHADMVSALEQRFSELEKSTDQAVSVSAGLIRYAVAVHIIYHVLPEGNPVVYATPEDDDIPNQPAKRMKAAEREISVTTGGSMVIEAESKGHEDAGQNGSYANSFFLPQYVDFDEQNQLLAGDLQEAKTHFHTLRRYLSALNSAVRLAPYMVVDEEFQARRYGILGQLVNQGRALASYQVKLLCETIQQRSANHTLDRGLSLSLPYFNDQTLMVEDYKFDIIPGGRVMFVPAFVVLAVRAEAKKILLNTALSHPTRMSMVQELCIIERAFQR